MPARRYYTCTTTALALATLVACVQTVDTTVNGQERVDECIATACTTLNVDGYGLRDYSQISAMSHVTSLMVSFTDFGDLTDVAGMEQLRELHIGYTPLNDLSGLADYPNLTLVHMQAVNSAALASARFPAALRELALGGEGLTDLSIVHRAPGLQRLYLETYVASDALSALEGHGSLRTIHLNDATRMELAPLLALPALREVSLSIEPGSLDPAQASVIARLRARGVRVSTEEIAVVVC